MRRRPENVPHPPGESAAMTTAVYVLNGPNLNMLGKREPHLYGRATLAEVEKRCREKGAELGFDIFFAQSNAEHQLIDWLHQAYEDGAAVVINPAGLSFRSIAQPATTQQNNWPDEEICEQNSLGRHRRRGYCAPPHSSCDEAGATRRADCARVTKCRQGSRPVHGTRYPDRLRLLRATTGGPEYRCRLPPAAQPLALRVGGEINGGRQARPLREAAQPVDSRN